MKDQITNPAKYLINIIKINPNKIAIKAEAVIIIQVFLRLETVSSRASTLVAYLIFS